MFQCLSNTFCEAGVIIERNTIQRIQCVHHSVINQFLSKIPLFAMGRAGINVSKCRIGKQIPELKNTHVSDKKSKWFTIFSGKQGKIIGIFLKQQFGVCNTLESELPLVKVYFYNELQITLHTWLETCEIIRKQKSAVPLVYCSQAPPNNKDKILANKITEEFGFGYVRTLKNLCRVLAFSVFTL